MPNDASSPRREPAIDLYDVAKTYRGKIHALKGIAMKVDRGEIFGLLGPNGAGKSTLVKIMMTAVRPTLAEGKVLGQPIGHKPTLAQVGYLPEHHRFPPYLTGRQVLEHYAALSKVDRHTRRVRSIEMLELVGLKNWAKAKVGTYSKGMQQRLGLAQAMTNDPELIVLDEPTDGLDPVGRREIRSVLHGLRDRGTTVFLNSHLLSEVEHLCDRVAILVGGKVIRQGTLDELTARSHAYEIELQADMLPGDSFDRLRKAVRRALPCEFQAAQNERPPTPVGRIEIEAVPTERGTLDSGEAIELDGTIVRIETSKAAAVQPVLDALRRADLTIHTVRPVRQSLEDFFIATVSDTPAS
ncbi:MAG TPA: ABC transporter ATP-binding protein [Thermoguttaceae bacterium]|nr:ABC transporter ATP-binding protein [Thermoguttaceae bacterium]